VPAGMLVVPPVNWEKGVTGSVNLGLLLFRKSQPGTPSPEFTFRTLGSYSTCEVVVVVAVVVIGLGLTQGPPGVDKQIAMVLLATLSKPPQKDPSSGFHETSCVTEIWLSPAIELQVSVLLGLYGLHLRASGRHRLPLEGKPRQ